MTELFFVLEKDEEDEDIDWPPAGVECLPCTVTDNGYKIEDAPFFIKGMSVGDVINAEFNENDEVISWKIVEKSGRSTIWILSSPEYKHEVEDVLAELRSIHCNTGDLSQFGLYLIDVPEDIEIGIVDKWLDKLDKTMVCIDYPSFRHKGP